jgi:hypothetical protein
MQCEPRWGDGLSAHALLVRGDGISTSGRARVDSLSPRPVSHSLREREPTRPLEGRVKWRRHRLGNV